MRIRYPTAVAALLAINFITIPGSTLSLGLASHEYAKQVGLLMLAACLFVWCIPLRRTGRWGGLVLISLAAFVGYASATLLWSHSVVESLRFINKLWLTGAAVALVAGVRDRDRVSLLEPLELVMVGYLGLTIFSEAFLRDILHPGRIGDPRLAGFGDIHGTKYLMSIVAIYGFSLVLAAGRRRWLLISIVAGLVVFLSLQRAIIGATLVAFGSVVALEVLRRRSVVVGLFAVASVVVLSVGAFWAVFEYPPMRDRMFPTETHAALAQRLLLAGRPSEVVSLIQLSGRDEFWLVAQELDVPFGGIGYGMAALTVEARLGERWELHNDYLKVSIETGPAGVAAYGVMLMILLVASGRRAISTRDGTVAALYLAAFGVTLITPLNGLFDNALDHVQKNVLYGATFFLVAESMRRTSSRIPDG